MQPSSKQYSFVKPTGDNSLDRDQSIIKWVNQILTDAINKQASDIHIEPYREFCRIRLRIDGLLHEHSKIDRLFSQRLTARLKIIANLDIAEKRLPQDGRFTIKLENRRNYDCRLSSCPTLFGEKLVVRILNPINVDLDFRHLGFNREEEQIFYQNITKPQGMILVTGPTGSGKTITLYSAINALNHINKNISTAEDPIEINLDGINQVEINHKIGLDFSAVLRTFLRQDPDIIMIGEIRDLETAEIAIKASHTGHLVLATLHTNSAISTLTRLLNMGIATFNLATALNLIIAQRLIRKLCNHCKTEQKLPDKILADNLLSSSSVIYTARGCQHCNNGYSGRIAVFEMLPITPKINRLILEHGNTSLIEKHLIGLNYLTLRNSAMTKVSSGITSLEEINRTVM